jgi:hypothetical protein
MKKLLFFVCLFVVMDSFAQEVVAAQGDSYSTTNASIDFTIGEVIIDTGTDGTNTITQGFHQSNWNFLGVEDYSQNFDATIFPNPTQDILTIKAPRFEGVTYMLYDAQGKLVMKDALSSVQTAIQVRNLAPGSYSLTLSNESNYLKTYKLIKTHEYNSK